MEEADMVPKNRDSVASVLCLLCLIVLCESQREKERASERERSVWIFRGGLRVEKGKKMKKKTTNVFFYFFWVC